MKHLAFIIVLLTLGYACSHPENSGSKLVQPATASATSKITCPHCGYSKTEVLPTDVCQIAYTCEKCKAVLHPKKGDCCVFCTYGDHKCPSKQ